jgi:RNA polymerase sigma factor (sigma-70 family)
VVTDHGATVLRVCLAVLGPTDADDAWSETFLSAMKAYPDLPVDANVEAWLVTIAHRKAIDVTRATARRALPVDQIPDTEPGPSADFRDLDLVTAMGQLPPKQRQAVAYHYLAGLQRGRRHRGQHHRCRAPRRRRRHSRAATHLSNGRRPRRRRRRR